MEVVAEGPERLNLISLFMRAALEERRATLGRLRFLLRGSLVLSVAGMSTTLEFSPRRVLIREGAAVDASARVRGSLEGFLALARGMVAGPLLAREVRISGNPLAALPLALVFRLTRQGSPQAPAAAPASAG